MAQFIGRNGRSRQHVLEHLKGTHPNKRIRESSRTGWLRKDSHHFCIILEQPRINLRLLRMASFREDAHMENSHGEVKTQERDRPVTSLLCLRLTSRQTRSINLVFIVGAIVPVCTPLIWSKRRMKGWHTIKRHMGACGAATPHLPSSSTRSSVCQMNQSRTADAELYSPTKRSRTDQHQAQDECISAEGHFFA